MLRTLITTTLAVAATAKIGSSANGSVSTCSGTAQNFALPAVYRLVRTSFDQTWKPIVEVRKNSNVTKASNWIPWHKADVYEPVGYYQMQCNSAVAFGTGMFKGYVSAPSSLIPPSVLYPSGKKGMMDDTLVVESTRKTVSDCNGIPLYYFVEENYKYGSVDVDLRICRDAACEVMIGYMLQRQTGSIMTGSDEMAVELYAVTADGSIASNYSVRASRDDTWYPSGDTLICDGTQACYHGNYWDIITNDMSAEVSDPRIILAITVDFMYRRLDLDSGICSTFTALGIVIGYMMAGCCVCFCCFVISPRSWWGLDAGK